MKRKVHTTRDKERGSALIELSLLAPWILFLFVGIVDMGFYCYALISVENAARVAAENASQNSTLASDKSTACTIARNELVNLPNLTTVTRCNSTPLTVTADLVTGTDGAQATSVSVTYQGVSLIPIPGLLIGRLDVTRNVQMRVRS
jgi:Flp pilus assembly protein TadG